MSTFYTWRQAVIKSQLASTTRHVLLTLGCHMNDMGESCYPSIETLCEETGLSNRAVITHLKLAVEAGFISCDKHGFSGQKWARNEYKATFPPLKVVNEVHHLEDKAVNVVPEGSERSDEKAVNDVHTNYPVNYSINKSNPRAQDTSPENRSMRPEGRYAIRLIDLGVAVTSMHPTLCKWVADGVDLDFLVECVGVARQQKPLPEKIAPNYLDRVLQTQLAQRNKPKVDNAWLYDDAALERKGRELGVQTRPGESWEDYRRRVKRVVDGSSDVAA